MNKKQRKKYYQGQKPTGIVKTCPECGHTGHTHETATNARGYAHWYCAKCYAEVDFHSVYGE